MSLKTTVRNSQTGEMESLQRQFVSGFSRRENDPANKRRREKSSPTASKATPRRCATAFVVPDVPITVDAKLPDEPTWTLRKRLHVTEADSCYKCHSKMNPLGLPFERFNDFISQFQMQGTTFQADCFDEVADQILWFR